MEGPWHAFYSNEQIDICINKIFNTYNKNNGIKTLSNYYILKDTDEEVETTCVYSVKDNPTIDSCNYKFEDGKYLGIVYKWSRICKYI